MKKKQEVKLTRIEKAIIILARHLERCPYCDYKVEQQVLEELGYERVKNSHKTN